jgi:hypothetical protein
MEAKHTPGPWTYEVEKVSGPSLATKTYVFAHGDVIGQAYETYNAGNAQANARLIAAAPELLEALRKAEPYVRAASVLIHVGDDLALIQAALAKAGSAQ